MFRASFRSVLFWLIMPALFADTGSASPGDPFGGVASAYLLSINDRPLWAHLPDKKLPPASLTKLMTALLVMENLQKGKTALVPAAIRSENGSSIGLAVGERIGVPELLAATLIRSANDACLTLAVHVSGSEKNFVRLMNVRAAELGLLSTHFTNACGHDSPGHYSTATDLAMLFRQAVRHPALAAIMETETMVITSSDKAKTYLLRSTNALLGRYPGIKAGKTGSTINAGECLIVYAARGKEQSLLVLLNANNRWWDAEKMLNTAFASSRREGRNP